MFGFAKPGVVLWLCWLTLIASVAEARQSSGPAADIHVNVDRVNVGVTVTDSRGEAIRGLRREDFRLFDDGSEQPITDFLATDEPAQVLILIEAGPAVYLLQEGHLQAIANLLNGLSPADGVAMARYNERAEPILQFTTDKSAAYAALDRLQFNLGFGRLNLASSLATAVDWIESAPGKKSLVLLSTGVDTSSSEAAKNLLSRLRASDVRVLAISIGAEMRDAKPTQTKRNKKDQAGSANAQAISAAFEQADQELRAIAEASGGRVYFPRTSQDFVEVCAEIARLVRHEYSLAFVPPVRDGKVHPIDVRLTNFPSASHIDHRQAYVAPQ